MIHYLTAQQVLFIHSRLIVTIGGEHGVRDLGLLESAVSRPQATFDGEDLYPELFTKTAVFMASLAQNHPFVDGNKRTAITSAALFLRQNGYRLQITNNALVAFTFLVVNEKPAIEEMAAWFKTNSKEIVSS